MADDLDGFFDEIDDAVAEVTEKGEASVPDGASQEASKTNLTASREPNSDGNAADSAAAAALSTDNTTTREASELESTRPAKRMRVAVASAPARPKGAVVAASAASSSKTPQQQQQPQPPPPPPPPNQSRNPDFYFGPGSNHNNNINNNNNSNGHLPPLPSGPMPLLPSGPLPVDNLKNNSNSNNKPVVRMAAGKSWVDETLSEWPENDFRIFVGNLGAEIDEASLLQHFSTSYPSATMAKIVREKATQKTKGYGFVSFSQPLDSAKAIREQDQSWLGSRPIRVKRSDWQERNKSTVQKKKRTERKQQRKRGGKKHY